MPLSDIIKKLMEMGAIDKKGMAKKPSQDQAPQKSAAPAPKQQEYSDLSKEPVQEPNEFPGDFFDRHKAWEEGLSPADKAKRRARKAQEANINLGL
jgi:hypothetical protein